MALITAGQMLCIPALMVGGMLGAGLSLAGVAFCTAAGGLILLVCVCFVGTQCSESGLPSTITSADALGVRGARFIPALLITITGIGWFGVQAAICGTSFSLMAADMLGISVPAWGATIFWGLVMSFSAMYGYPVLKHLYYIMTPVLFLILIYMVIRMVFSDAGSAAALFAWRPAKPMPYVTGITLVVGDWAMGAFTSGDYCRYAKRGRAAILGLSAGLIPVIPVVFLGGAIFRIAAGNADITAVLNGMGFPAISLIFLIFAAWALNMMNAYSGGIALSVLLGFEEKRLKLSTALTGIAGTVLGAAGILSLFTNFLGLLSSFVPPAIGILMGAKLADLLIRGGIKESPPFPEEGITGGFHLPGIIAYGAGALSAWLTTAVIPLFIPPLNGIIAAMAVYVILEMVLRGYKKGKRP
jgi:cytosine permease